jgi:hypothetical protein
MKTILFFDDWSIQHSRGVVRRWFSAEPWPEHKPAVDPLLKASFNAPTVERNPETGRWRLWGIGYTDQAKGDEGSGLYVYESEDGIEWRPSFQKPIADERAVAGLEHLVFSGEFTGNGLPFYDAVEKDPARRYKVAYTDLSSNAVASEGMCRIAVSPDGIHWTIDKSAVWRDQHTDTGCSILYNPWTKKYQFTSRPILGDRRIALYETTDWKTFTKPQIIIHPDPFDPPNVEFYGMPHFFYEGYFVGFLHRQHGAFGDDTIPSRFKGRVDSELVYSINGTHWNRTNRMPFLPDGGIGKHGFGNEYPHSMVADEDGWLRVYTASIVGEHSDGDKFPAGEKSLFLTISRFRRDGFCAMESVSDIGHLTLRPLIFHAGKIQINAAMGRFGKIRAEIRKVPDGKAIPGFELENSIPVEGDGHFLTLRWKGGETVDQLKGKPVRLFLELDQARLFAVRVEADYCYGWVPEPNLVGDYIPNTCY